MVAQKTEVLCSSLLPLFLAHYIYQEKKKNNQDNLPLYCSTRVTLLVFLLHSDTSIYILDHISFSSGCNPYHSVSLSPSMTPSLLAILPTLIWLALTSDLYS